MGNLGGVVLSVVEPESVFLHLKKGCPGLYHKCKKEHHSHGVYEPGPEMKNSSEAVQRNNAAGGITIRAGIRP